jgi:hypothetical protein
MRGYLEMRPAGWFPVRQWQLCCRNQATESSLKHQHFPDERLQLTVSVLIASDPSCGAGIGLPFSGIVNKQMILRSFNSPSSSALCLLLSDFYPLFSET